VNKELKLSYEILSKVIVDKSYVTIELNKNVSKNTALNTALITKIVYGVLEKDISLEYFVSQYITKKPNVKVMILLKIVAYVSKYLKSIPDFALVNEIVNLSKSIDRHISGFINAVSKKIIQGKLILPDKKNYIKYLSVKYDYPEWVIGELLKEHDNKFVEDLLSYELTTLTHIRVNLDKITVAEFKKLLEQNNIEYQNSLYDYTMYVDYSKLIGTPIEEFFIVQGLPSIITANVLGADGGKVLDVCSAPGGKAMLLAQNRNNTVFACDIYPHRVELIKKYAKSLGLNNIKYFVQDGTKTNNDWLEKFDFVMCDVPCSNLGVSRKKPDVFLNKTIADTMTLAGIQYKILENSAKYVKSGGILQYSTCTILNKENKDVILKFLKNHKEFELTPISFENIDVYNDNNMYTFYPHKTKTEGFFIGRLKKK